MKINPVNLTSAFSPVSSGRTEKLTKNDKDTCIDRVEISGKPTAENVNAKIAELSQKISDRRLSSEILDEIKQRISQNNYFVSADDIAKSIL